MENIHTDVRVKRGPKGRTVHLFTLGVSKDRFPMTV